MCDETHLECPPVGIVLLVGVIVAHGARTLGVVKLLWLGSRRGRRLATTLLAGHGRWRLGWIYGKLATQLALLEFVILDLSSYCSKIQSVWDCCVFLFLDREIIIDNGSITQLENSRCGGREVVPLLHVK